MATKKDYYEILELQKGASDEDIKKAYRKLAKKFHPDANPNDPSAEERFKEIGEAYGVLSDPQKKAAYDQYGHDAFDQMGGAGGYGFSGFDANDIFEQFFGGGFENIFGSSTRSRTGARRGADVQVNITISFEEAFLGTEKDITIPLHETCSTCKGSGAKPGTVAENCKQCNGTGQERVLQQTMFGTMQQIRTCRSCSGKGKIIKERCQSCGGSGKVRRNKTFSVTIPRGIDSGQTIKLSGKGEPGERGGPSGDILVTSYVQPHNVFTRRDYNLFLDIPISFVKATLGGEISIPTMEGLEKYTVKPGTQTGTVISIKNKGMPNVRNNRIIGDLIVTFKVIVPTQLTDSQRQALINFAEETGEEVDTKKGIFGKIKDSFSK